MGKGSKSWLGKCLGWTALLGAVLLATAVWSVSMGSTEISIGSVWGIISSKIPFVQWIAATGWQETDEVIVWQIRMPRVFLAGLVGMGLAVAGAAFQGVLRNPLADPYTLGISSGAALGAALGIILGWQGAMGVWTLPVMAFTTALATMAMVFRFAFKNRNSGMETLILAGVVVQSFAGALLTFILAISSDKMQQIIYWLLGSVAMAKWEHGLMVLPIVILGTLLIWMYARELNILALGEQSAQHIGVPVNRVRLTLLFAASMITGAVVSLSGTIGFVGLVVPHIMRQIVGNDHRILIPVSALSGAVLLIAADTLARTVMEPQELPIGAITAFLGAPFFGYLLMRRRKSTYL